MFKNTKNFALSLVFLALCAPSGQAVGSRSSSPQRGDGQLKKRAPLLEQNPSQSSYRHIQFANGIDFNTLPLIVTRKINSAILQLENEKAQKTKERESLLEKMSKNGLPQDEQAKNNEKMVKLLKKNKEIEEEIKLYEIERKEKMGIEGNIQDLESMHPLSKQKILNCEKAKEKVQKEINLVFDEILRGAVSPNQIKAIHDQIVELYEKNKREEETIERLKKQYKKYSSNKKSIETIMKEKKSEILILEQDKIEKEKEKNKLLYKMSNDLFSAQEERNLNEKLIKIDKDITEIERQIESKKIYLNTCEKEDQTNRIMHSQIKTLKQTSELRTKNNQYSKLFSELNPQLAINKNTNYFGPTIDFSEPSGVQHLTSLNNWGIGKNIYGQANMPAGSNFSGISTPSFNISTGALNVRTNPFGLTAQSSGLYHQNSNQFPTDIKPFNYGGIDYKKEFKKLLKPEVVKKLEKLEKLDESEESEESENK